MHKRMHFKFPALLLLSALLASGVSASTIQTIDEYNEKIPMWGASWLPVNALKGNVYLSFYTGFAPRVENPARIHVRVSRGNQGRVTLILDEQTLYDYPFDLVARAGFYQQMLDEGWIDIDMENKKGNAVAPQARYFIDIVNSPVYSIAQTVSDLKAQKPDVIDRVALYRKSLDLLKTLNPERVFPMDFDLKVEFDKWLPAAKAFVGEDASGEAITKKIADNPNDALVLTNDLLFGRVNAIELSDTSEELLVDVLAAIVGGQDYSDPALLAKTADLFRSVTGGKYDFNVVNGEGQLVPALDCREGGACRLTYHEFTGIYPIGSIKSSTRDRHGNVINTYATPGLWQFLSRKYHEIDNMRSEFYYGMIPKMDYEGLGNGFHNPAVRFAAVPKSVKESLSIPEHHAHFWAVKRGRVSHGCNRMSAGHVWEIRNIFPVENTRATQVYYHGNDPKDFDLFDINGDGQPEVMGVTYYISYNAKGTSWAGKREGANLEVDVRGTEKFYQNLLGAKDVFTYGEQGITIHDPGVSYFTKEDFRKKRAISKVIEGDFPYYEQTYERDKIQFYRPLKIQTGGNFMISKEGQKAMPNSSPSKQFVRLFGRVRGCAPFSDKEACGEEAFLNEKNQLLKVLASN
ncbi:MAG: hypothetical protein P8Y83_04475 [Gammaproteobacteria bacterium]|jgi:hypothetical protein